MAIITFNEFNKAAGKTLRILILLLAFFIFKFIKGVSSAEYISLFIITIVCFLSLWFFLGFSKAMIKDNNLKMSIAQKIVLEVTPVICLGFLSLYIFLVKGCYGIYLLFESFDWWLLIIRITIIIVSASLANSVVVIQGALQWLSNNTWTKINN